MFKNKLRKLIIDKLKKQKGEILTKNSNIIAETVKKNSCFALSEVVCCYSSFGFEVDTSIILAEVLACGKILVIPRCNMEDNTLSLYEVDSLDKLQKGSFGIMEPDSSCNLYQGNVGTFIVPGIAFTKNGKRLGRGKGYYDRLLSEYPDSKKIALAFEMQVVKDLEVSVHDVFMDEVITEKQTYKK